MYVWVVFFGKTLVLEIFHIVVFGTLLSVNLGGAAGCLRGSGVLKVARGVSDGGPAEGYFI